MQEGATRGQPWKRCIFQRQANRSSACRARTSEWHAGLAKDTQQGRHPPAGKNHEIGKKGWSKALGPSSLTVQGRRTDRSVGPWRFRPHGPRQSSAGSVPMRPGYHGRASQDTGLAVAGRCPSESLMSCVVSGQSQSKRPAEQGASAAHDPGEFSATGRDMGPTTTQDIQASLGGICLHAWPCSRRTSLYVCHHPLTVEHSCVMMSRSRVGRGCAQLEESFSPPMRQTGEALFHTLNGGHDLERRSSSGRGEIGKRFLGERSPRACPE